MSKRLGLVFVVSFFCLVLAQNAFAATLTKEFTFELSPGETSKNWEINVPLPENETGKFIGRDFKPIVKNGDTILEVEKEVLSEKKYYAKGKLVNSDTTKSLSHSGVMKIVLYIGTKQINDTPAGPSMITWGGNNPIQITRVGLGDKGKKLPVSARYFYYQLKEEISNSILLERVVPIYLTGFQFSINYNLQKDVKYLLDTQVSNISGKYTTPTTIKISSK